MNMKCEQMFFPLSTSRDGTDQVNKDEKVLNMCRRKRMLRKGYYRNLQLRIKSINEC